MDKPALRKHLQALASGKKSDNAAVVEAYLADEGAALVARVLEDAVGRFRREQTPLLPPSSCLVLLD